MATKKDEKKKKKKKKSATKKKGKEDKKAKKSKETKKKSKLSEKKKKRKSIFCCKASDSESELRVLKRKQLTKRKKKDKDDSGPDGAKLKKQVKLKARTRETKENEKKLLRQKLLRQKTVLKSVETTESKTVPLPHPPPDAEAHLITLPPSVEKKPVEESPMEQLDEATSATDLSMAKKMEEEKDELDSSPPTQSLRIKTFYASRDMSVTCWEYEDSRPNSLEVARPKLDDILRHVTDEHPDTMNEETDCRCWKCRLQKAMSTLK